MLNTLLTVLTGIAIAAVSSWITVHLSIRQFRSQRWWEKKVEAYERVIEAFHKYKKFSSEYLITEYFKGNEVSEERAAELRAQSKEGWDEISRASDVGQFFLSEKAVKILQKCEQEKQNKQHYDSWNESLEADWSLAEQYMQEFIVEAQRDLSPSTSLKILMNRTKSFCQ